MPLAFLTSLVLPFEFTQDPTAVLAEGPDWENVSIGWVADHAISVEHSHDLLQDHQPTKYKSVHNITKLGVSSNDLNR